MQIQITQDQCYCSFEDGIVYEFVKFNADHIQNLCKKCAFRYFSDPLVLSSECALTSCQSAFRRDKKTGFWQVSETIDYEQFI